MLKTNYCAKLTKKQVGESVTAAGWVHARRDHGRIIFIDLRDSTGLLQVVFTPQNKEAYQIADKFGVEDCVQIKGKIQARPKNLVNKKLKSGEVELLATEANVFSKAKNPPFEISKDTKEVDEEIRLKYRYLDLRSARMHKNLKNRAKIVSFFRNFLDREGFTEIETPYITKGTPEGAREFIIPARLHRGKFYVLPQSPQQFKQLLMVAGIEKYYQIARCFRDEDPRGDRQAEHTQIDLEMSFVAEKDILSLTEKMYTKMIDKLYPLKKITKTPFPVLTYDEAMQKYGSDKPDLRQNINDKNELAFAWIVDFPLFEWSESKKRLVSSHHLFTAPKDEDIAKLETAPEKVRAKAYDFVLNGVEIGGGSIRIHNPEIQKKIFQILQIGKREAEKRFGHLLKAFTYGVPPHGGIAPGIDRIAMVLEGEPNIREVMAFPKTGDSRDVMMGAPSTLPPDQLKEAGIKIIRTKRRN